MRAKISFGLVLTALLVAGFCVMGAARSEAGVAKAVLRKHYSTHQSLYGKVRHNHIMAKGGR